MRSILRFLGATVLAFAPAVALAGNLGQPEFPADELLLSTLHLVNKAEVSDGALAGRISTTPRVKAYAKNLAKHHVMADRKVKRLATVLGVSMTSVIELAPQLRDKMRVHAEKQAVLSRLSGREFDVAFLRHSRDDHREAITKLEAALPTISDERLKALVERLLPMMRRHEARAVRILAGFEG